MVASAFARIAKASAVSTPARALSTSVLATSTARAALATTPLARVVRKNGVYVPQRYASSEEGAQTMVRFDQTRKTTRWIGNSCMVVVMVAQSHSGQDCPLPPAPHCSVAAGTLLFPHSSGFIFFLVLP